MSRILGQMSQFGNIFLGHLSTFVFGHFTKIRMVNIKKKTEHNSRPEGMREFKCCNASQKFTGSLVDEHLHMLLAPF